MTKDEFETTLRQNLHRQPFRPFAVELTDGRRIIIRELPVVFNDEGASFIDAGDGALVDFDYDEVRSFGPLKKEEIRMTKDEFETSLRHYIYQEPFRPFVVEMTDGRRMIIKQLPVVFCDGAATFLDPDEDVMVDFYFDEARSFGPLEQEVPT